MISWSSFIAKRLLGSVQVVAGRVSFFVFLRFAEIRGGGIFTREADLKKSMPLC
jgi:hypothetical protein